MSKLVNWKIFYDDRGSFSSDDGTPSEAPTEGVLLIVQKGEHLLEEEYILNGGEFYVFIEDRWYQKWKLTKDEICLKGRKTDNITWRQAKAEAIEYAEL